MRIHGLTIYLVAVTIAFISHSRAVAEPTAADIEKLVEQLGSEDFRDRQSAMQELREIGEPALRALEKATADPSAEISFRAKKIFEEIQLKKSGFVELTQKATSRLNQKIGRFAGNTLDSLPRGVQKLDGVPFHIDEGILQLGSARMPDRPRKIEGVQIGRTGKKLHFLHATAFGGNFGAEDGDLIAKYRVHFEDGTHAEIPVEFGIDVRDWWNDDESKAVKRGKVVWNGNNAVAKDWGHSLRLYRCSWDNPHPDKVVSSIDFVAAHESAAPFCVAITCE